MHLAPKLSDHSPLGSACEVRVLEVRPMGCRWSSHGLHWTHQITNTVQILSVAQEGEALSWIIGHMQLGSCLSSTKDCGKSSLWLRLEDVVV